MTLEGAGSNPVVQPKCPPVGCTAKRVSTLAFVVLDPYGAGAACKAVATGQLGSIPRHCTNYALVALRA